MAFSKYPTWVYGAAGLLLGLLAVGAYSYWQDHQTPLTPEPYHIHADFALVINGEKFNFAQEKYMAESAGTLSEFVHLHDMDGEIIHVHARGIRLGDFFQTLGMKLETRTGENGIGQEVCFTDDEGNETCYPRFGCYEMQDGQAICVDPIVTAQSWRLFVNGEQIVEDAKIGDYVMQNLDQILLTNISFDGDLENELSLVTDKACIQSGTCPERGTPSDESSCAGSGECGTGVIPVGE